MSDIVDKLLSHAARMGTRNSADYIAFISVEETKEAAETIQQLRSALRQIGYDYVELSHDKVQWLYLEHIEIARKAYQNSFTQKDEPDEPSK